RRDGLRVLRQAELVVQVADLAAGAVFRGQAGRRGRGRVDAGVVEVLLAEQRDRGTTDGDGRGQRQRVAAGVTEDLEAGVAEHVPREAKARSELVLDLDVGLAFTVLVLERIPAGAEVRDEVVGDVPAVLDVVRGLIDGHRRTGLEHARTHGVVVDVQPVHAARVRLAGHRLEVVDVHTAAQQVVAQLPFGVDAVLVAGVLGVRAAQGGRQVAAGADMAAGGVDVRLRAAIDDQGATVRALADVAGVGVADAVRRHAVVGAREGA